MLIGLAGSHRSGKTTLAKKMAEDLGITYFNTSTTEVARQLGFDPVAPMSLQERVVLQQGLLEHHLGQLDKLPRPLIADRTPADYLAYMLCEFHMQSHKEVSDKTLEAVEQFKQIAMNVLIERYHHVFVICQLPGYKAEPGKPAFNRPFQSHHHLLVEGILSATARKLNYSIVRTTELDRRVELMHDALVKMMDETDKKRRSSPLYN